jgi:hypothetical protein
MSLRTILVFLLVICSTCAAVLAQEAVKPAAAQDIDLSAFVKETQQSPNEAGYAGLVWWIPAEYWEISAVRTGMSEEKAKQRFAPLRKYTVVAVAVGKVGIGTIDWVPEPEIRGNVLLRDANGNTY